MKEVRFRARLIEPFSLFIIFLLGVYLGSGGPPDFFIGFLLGGAVTMAVINYAAYFIGKEVKQNEK